MPLCYRCGAPASEETEFCPQCGIRLTTRSQGFDLLKIFGGISLILSALTVGAAGACFVVFSTSPPGAYGGGSGMLVIGLPLLAVAALYFFGFCKLVRSSPPRPIWLIVLTVFGMALPALWSFLLFGNILAFLPVSGIAPAGRGSNASTIMILAAVVGVSIALLLAANKFFKRK